MEGATFQVRIRRQYEVQSLGHTPWRITSNGFQYEPARHQAQDHLRCLLRGPCIHVRHTWLFKLQ